VLTRIAAVAALLFLGLVPAALADTPAPGTLSVQGQGSVNVTPDEGAVSVSVNRSAPTSAAALSAANRHADAVVAAARRLGLAPAQIQTQSVDTSCSRVKVGPKGHRHTVTRCEADESLTLTTTTTRIGALIDAATRAGASSISGPDFSFSDPSAGEIAAENKAIADARSQAVATAAQLGYSVTGVQSVELNPGSGVVASSGSSAAAAPSKSAVPTTVHPGTQEVDATVAVVFTIAPQ
jgi:uncharacterized protein YggE